MLLQAIRNVDADPALARAWWDLAVQGLWHEADIDIYHTLVDPAPIYNGGTFTHTAHGVEAGRSTHRGAPQEEMWGLLDWPWQKGSTPEAGHFRTRGILNMYYLTGDRHLRDAAWDATRLVDWKIRNNRFPQIDVPDRSNGNNLQILMDWYLLTWDAAYLESIDKLTANLDFDAVTARSGEPKPSSAWGAALYVKSLARLIEVLTDKGLPTDKISASCLKYAQAIYEYAYARPNGWREGTWSYLSSRGDDAGGGPDKGPGPEGPVPPGCPRRLPRPGQHRGPRRHRDLLEQQGDNDDPPGRRPVHALRRPDGCGAGRAAAVEPVQA